MAEVDLACISVVAPSTIIHARYLCKKVRAKLPTIKIMIGLWGATENIAETSQRLGDSGADQVVVSLGEAVRKIAEVMPPSPENKTLSAPTELKDA
jgi:hypothetical protein